MSKYLSPKEAEQITLPPYLSEAYAEFAPHLVKFLENVTIAVKPEILEQPEYQPLKEGALTDMLGVRDGNPISLFCLVHGLVTTAEIFEMAAQHLIRK